MSRYVPEPYPWHLNHIRLAPMGLRESVARISRLSIDEVERVVYSTGSRMPALYRTVARWRLLSPRKWRELLYVLARPIDGLRSL